VRGQPGEDGQKRDGYAAVQLAFGDIKESKVNKPSAGHFAKAGSYTAPP
jgi:hypothetical protein